MKKGLFIGGVYLLIALELFLGDKFILVRYLHFAYLPYFLMVALFFMGLLLVNRQKILWFLPAFAFIFYTFLSPLAGSLFPSAKASTSSSGSAFKLMSYSINSRNHKYQEVAQLIKDNPADLICLQEIPFNQYQNFVDAMEKEKLGYQHIYSKISASMLLSKQEIIPHTTLPFQKATAILDGKKVRVWNIHSPKSLRQKHYQSKFYNTLGENVNMDKSEHKIICGDFNATPHNEYLRPFFKDFQPAFHQSEKLLNFTYPTNASKIPTSFPFLKIDYLFFSKNFTINNYKRLSTHANSDHYPITASATIQD